MVIPTLFTEVFSSRCFFLFDTVRLYICFLPSHTVRLYRAPADAVYQTPHHSYIKPIGCIEPGALLLFASSSPPAATCLRLDLGGLLPIATWKSKRISSKALAGLRACSQQGTCLNATIAQLNSQYVLPGCPAMHHELGLAGPFPIGMQGGETHRTKAVGISLDNEAVGISLENATPS